MENINTVKDNYLDIVQKNLETLFSNLPVNFSANLPGRQIDHTFEVTAFGRSCIIANSGITLSSLNCSRDRGISGLAPSEAETAVPEKKEALNQQGSVLAILISLYALHACPDTCITEPFRGFKEFPGTMPYVGAFTTHTEQLLIPAVSRIRNRVGDIKKILRGEDAPAGTAGDFAFVVYPLPKIALCYIFYEADEDFDPSVTCLFSSNADRFISTAGLADVGEYTSRSILEIIAQG